MPFANLSVYTICTILFIRYFSILKRKIKENETSDVCILPILLLKRKKMKFFFILLFQSLVVFGWSDCMCTWNLFSTKMTVQVYAQFDANCKRDVWLGFICGRQVWMCLSHWIDIAIYSAVKIGFSTEKRTNN